MNALPQALDRLTDQMSSDDIFQLAYAVRQRAIDKRRAEQEGAPPRHPATPNYLEYPTFDESCGFDPIGIDSEGGSHD